MLSALKRRIMGDCGMTRLDELSIVSNAVLTPHLNCDLSVFIRSATFSTHSDSGRLTDHEKRFRKNWCDKQKRNIGTYGAVLSCGK